MQHQSQELVSSILTSAQEQRYYSLVSTYGERQALEIVKSLTDRGRNSYSAFIDKMEEVMKAKHDELDYYNSLYEVLELNKFVSLGDVIRIVGDIRRSLELEPYRTKLKMRCEADFFRLFVFKEVYDDTIVSDRNDKTLIGYMPVARVRPDEAN